MTASYATEVMSQNVVTSFMESQASPEDKAKLSQEYQTERFEREPLNNILDQKMADTVARKSAGGLLGTIAIHCEN